MKLRKIYLSCVSLIVLLVTSVSATFAWNIANWRVYVDTMEVNISQGEGILISIDNQNFKSKISESDIKKAIVLKSLGYSYLDGILVDKDNSRVDLKEDEIETKFNQIEIQTVSSLDGTSFKDYNGNNCDATSAKYISFDLYFTTEDQDTDYDEDGNLITDGATVYFNYSDLNYDESNQKIVNTSITSTKITTTKDTTKANYLKSGLTTFDLNGNSVEYASGADDFTLYAADATRFSTTVENATKIYELNLGHGSYATDLDSSLYKDSSMYYKASSLDKTKSASFTYLKGLNGGHDVDKAKLSLEEVPETYKDFYSLESDKVLDLKKGEKKRVSFNFWIEGRDADCFDAIVGSSFKINLSFTTKAYTMYERLKTINYHDGDNIKTYNYYDFKKNFDIYLPLSSDKKFMGWFVDQSYQSLFDFNSIIDSLDTTYDVYALWV